MPGVGMFMGFDPLLILISVVGGVIAFGAQALVKSAFARYSRVGNTRNLSGAEAAQLMLQSEGVNDVQIRRYEGGWLSDHYNPATKIINLSPEVYDGRSVASVGIACHEAGHALQHAQGYAFLKLRSLLVPVVGIGSKLGMWILMIGFALAYAQQFASDGNGVKIATFGLILFSSVFLFQLITLPVEWNASTRSKHALVSHGIVAPGAETRGVSAVLNAAALTYLAAAISSLLQILYFAYRLGLFNRRSRE